MVMDRCIGMMVAFTKDNGKMEYSMDMVIYNNNHRLNICTRLRPKKRSFLVKCSYSHRRINFKLYK